MAAFSGLLRAIHASYIAKRPPAATHRLHHPALRLQHTCAEYPNRPLMVVWSHVTRFLVKPSETRDFVEAFLKVREEAVEEKGNLIYSLSKPLTDNVSFYAYAGASLARRAVMPHAFMLLSDTWLKSLLLRDPLPSVLLLRLMMHRQMLRAALPTRAVLLAEWADREAFKTHIKSDYVKNFAEYITEVSSHCRAGPLSAMCVAV